MKKQKGIIQPLVLLALFLTGTETHRHFKVQDALHDQYVKQQTAIIMQRTHDEIKANPALYPCQPASDCYNN